jgi:hypothetical protein
VKLVASQNGIAGARFWRVAGERPAVTHEVGQLPEANTLRAGQLLSGVQSAPASGSHLAWVLGNASHRLGILEAFGDAPLPPTTIDRVDELKRYAEAALDEPAPRLSSPEMVMVLDAFRRLNSTLDLAEVSQVISELAIRYTGAERATVFLYDSDRDEIWSLARHGNDQKEIRFPAARGVAGWVARHGESANLPDAYADSRFAADVDRAPGQRTRTLLTWPLAAKNGKTFAVLQLLNKHESGRGRCARVVHRRRRAGACVRGCPDRRGARKCSPQPHPAPQFPARSGYRARSRSSFRDLGQNFVAHPRDSSSLRRTAHPHGRRRLF